MEFLAIYSEFLAISLSRVHYTRLGSDTLRPTRKDTNLRGSQRER
jgi:hypothetical protein